MNRSSSLLGVPGDLAGAESSEVADVEDTGASGATLGLGRGRGRGRDVDAMFLNRSFRYIHSRNNELLKVGTMEAPGGED